MPQKQKSRKHEKTSVPFHPLSIEEPIAALVGAPKRGDSGAEECGSTKARALDRRGGARYSPSAFCTLIFE